MFIGNTREHTIAIVADTTLLKGNFHLGRLKSLPTSKFSTNRDREKYWDFQNFLKNFLWILYTPPSSSLTRKKKSYKTKALHHVFIWCMDTLNPENEKNSMSLFWKNAIFSVLPYQTIQRRRGKITKGSTLYFDECPYTI